MQKIVICEKSGLKKKKRGGTGNGLVKKLNCYNDLIDVPPRGFLSDYQNYLFYLIIIVVS